MPKLVCTTIRPSQLYYTELYDLDGCCSFVADFILYEVRRFAQVQTRLDGVLSCSKAARLLL